MKKLRVVVPAAGASVNNVLTALNDENNFYSKPEHVFNMEETGCHINNDPGILVTTQGAKSVKFLTKA